MQVDRHAIRILRRGEPVEISDFSPTETLLDYLRLRDRAIGTKEGCAEGDCGACTVAIGRLDGNGKVVYRPVNACIHLLGMADGAEVVTVEDLATDGHLHPIQQAMVDHDASQCGFCTPGFVMALFALYHRSSPEEPDRAAVNDAIAGNLCRCTGYKPIVAAALEACKAPTPDNFGTIETARKLAELGADRPLFVGDETRFFAAPATIDELASLYILHPDATLVAGATDVGLWITKQMRPIERIIHLGRVAALNGIADTGDAIVIGAATTYAEAWDALTALDPDIAEVLRRLGSPQVRAAGTVGGNIANGSPIGDTPPLLIVLGSEITLRRGPRTRVVPLEDFFLDYGKQDRGPGEFVESIHVPKPGPHTQFRAYKISKRVDQDISAVLAAFAFDIVAGEIRDVRIAFGGMAGIPKRASSTEAALRGAGLHDFDRWTEAFDALVKDFTPMSDHRASAGYRMQVARNLLYKALVEVSGAETGTTRLVGHREHDDALRT
ncbi:xanthine dehydrogenase small subunit [Microbaculum sp. FT89]|uniref:xanthine dehydrogenase small subunit n=1 Tax=Microbaculum sp. FT89 TaxID=3447298 RepID=UPI003F530AEB